MNWELVKESKTGRHRVYARSTLRGDFDLTVIRGRSGFGWRVTPRGTLRKLNDKSLVRFPNTTWDTVEGLAFLYAENHVTSELEQLAAIAEG
jgi:hypothetical protein